MTKSQLQTMKSQIRLSTEIQQFLCCPSCKMTLELIGDEFRCTNFECGKFFPIIKGIPILISESNSVFSIDDFINQHNTFFDISQRNNIKETIKRILPDIGRNIKAEQNYKKFAQHLLSQSSAPKVLVLGGSILGDGMEAFLLYPTIELVETDVSFGPRTTLICDAHDIPFENNLFDGVIVQAVLEHVVDPSRCVEEIYRILKGDGRKKYLVNYLRV